jgi:type IV secretion system protein VirD4
MEVFVGNTAVKWCFSVNDNFTAEYISKAIRQTSFVTGLASWLGLKDPQASQQALVSPDEVRSGYNMFVFIGTKAPALFAKLPYYKNEVITVRADRNPYID